MGCSSSASLKGLLRTTTLCMSTSDCHWVGNSSVWGHAGAGEGIAEVGGGKSRAAREQPGAVPDHHRAESTRSLHFLFSFPLLVDKHLTPRPLLLPLFHHRIFPSLPTLPPLTCSLL